MGARASRRRHEGRAIRRDRRLWRAVTVRFRPLSAATRRVTVSMTRLVEVLDTPSGTIAVAQRPDGGTTLGFDPRTADPSQTGVEAVRSTHSAADKVDAAAARLGLELTSWQRNVAIAVLDGKPLTWNAARTPGKATVVKVLDEIRGPEAGEPIIDEIHRMPLV